MFMRPTQMVELFGNIFASPIIVQGLEQFVLKFWTNVRRVSRRSRKLNTRVCKIGVFRPISRFMSKTVQDTDIITKGDE